MAFDANGLCWSAKSSGDDCETFKWGSYYFRRGGADSDFVSLDGAGLQDMFRNTNSVSGAVYSTFAVYDGQLYSKLRKRCIGCANETLYDNFNAHEFDAGYDVTQDGACMFAIGRGRLFNEGTCWGNLDCSQSGRSGYSGICQLHFYVRDRFDDACDAFNLVPDIIGKIDTGTAFKIRADWWEIKAFGNAN
jgi:hypothetical protein